MKKKLSKGKILPKKKQKIKLINSVDRQAKLVNKARRYIANQLAPILRQLSHE